MVAKGHYEAAMTDCFWYCQHLLIDQYCYAVWPA
jgi:hypothetical protein